MAIVFAHRGAPLERPENTLASFRRALELGADALETDVHLTADGAIVAIHDAHGARVAGVERRIASSTLAEVKAWDLGYVFVDARGERPFVGQGHKIATLEQILGELPKVRVNIDLKDEDPALARRFLEIVRRHSAEERIVAASFSRKPLRILREAGWRGEMSLARVDFLETWLVPRVLQRRRSPRLRAQIPTHAGPLRVDTPRVVRKLHELGLAVDYWTINDPEEAKRLVERGADGIITDDPARIVPAVSSCKSPAL
ncbi:MAG TPA: glycerophosphodiester phosphodiesterase [Polyangiaceae bacterium]|nr:glycerophosphodiester phosphodiesterase [Polyangiaceae bacterium]